MTCARAAGNHTNDYGKQCELDPLYNDVKINDRTILVGMTPHHSSTPRVKSTTALKSETRVKQIALLLHVPWIMKLNSSPAFPPEDIFFNMKNHL